MRERQLAPGRGTPRAVVERVQRERIYGAMVACVADKGYAQTSIEDLSRISGVSSRSFYLLFADKEECFLATLEEIIGSFQAEVSAALPRDGDATGKRWAKEALGALAQQVVAQPAAARVLLVDAFCSGERARERVSGAVDEARAGLGLHFAMLPGHEGMPEELTRAILGGIAGTLYRRLAQGRVEEIPAMVEALYEWASNVHPPPRPLRVRGRRGVARSAGSPPFAAHVPGERVLRGFSAAVARKGYAATTITDVAATASISQSTFYSHFRDKEDALMAALDSSNAQMTAAVLPAMRRSPQWPGVVRVGLETICAFLTAEPDFAHLRQVEVYCVGPAAVAKRDEAGIEIAEMMVQLAGSARLPSRIGIEAGMAAVASLLYDAVRSSSPQLAQVPALGTYLVLAPVLGAETAAEVAIA